MELLKKVIIKKMKNHSCVKQFTVLLILIGLVLSACRPRLDIPPILPPEASFTPSQMPTATPTFMPSFTHTPSPIPLPSETPTPKPVTFKVGPNDDMFSVALYFGVSLEALKTANPEVYPNAMGIGTELLIPITPTPVSAAEIAPSQTSLATKEDSPALAEDFKTYCYRDAMSAVYCFSLIENKGDEALENVSLLVTLSDETGKTEQAIATTLLNVIPAQSKLPAASYFLPEWGEELSVQAELDFQLPFAEGESRYLEVEISEQEIEYIYERKAAKVQGIYAFKNKNTSFMTLNILAVAYDENGAVLGMRRHEHIESGNTATESPFSLTVYSMAGEIHHVEVFIESMPFPPEPTQIPTP